jgi:hypothetical protein
MKPDENLRKEEVSTQSLPELLLNEESLRLFSFNEMEEETEGKRERWFTFKSP